MAQQILNTSSVQKHRLFDYWNDVVCRSFVELECAPLTSRGRFYGSVENNDFETLKLSRVVSSPQHVRRSRHCLKGSESDVFLLSIQMQGKGLILQDGREALLQPGDFALYDTTRKYALHFEEQFSQLVLRIPREVTNRFLVTPEQLTARTVSGASGAGRVFRNLILSVADEWDELDPAAYGDVEQTVVGLLGMAFGGAASKFPAVAPTTRYAVLTRVRNFIADNLSDPELSPESIARGNGISVRYLNKLFELEDCSVSRWMWRERLKRAKSLLINPCYRHLTISEIAYSCGFNSDAHFSRSFKAAFGQPPGDYRRTHNLS